MGHQDKRRNCQCTSFHERVTRSWDQKVNAEQTSSMDRNAPWCSSWRTVWQNNSLSNHAKIKHVCWRACRKTDLRCLRDPQIEQDVGFSWLRLVTQPHSSQVQRLPFASALLPSSGPFICSDKTEGEGCVVSWKCQLLFHRILSACDARPILFFLFPEGDSGFLTDFSDWQKPQATWSRLETVRSSMSPWLDIRWPLTNVGTDMWCYVLQVLLSSVCIV